MWLLVCLLPVQSHHPQLVGQSSNNAPMIEKLNKLSEWVVCVTYCLVCGDGAENLVGNLFISVGKGGGAGLAGRSL